MLITCWITKATDTHSEYVILIAFPRQPWLRELASMLRYTYIYVLVYLKFRNRRNSVLRFKRQIVSGCFIFEIIHNNAHSKFTNHIYMFVCLFVFLALQPTVVVFFTARYRALASSYSRFLDHIQRRVTVGRTPLDE
jgi:hypothetical protein